MDEVQVVAKLQGHLELLRSQHRKLQSRNAELERALAAANATAPVDTVMAGMTTLLGGLYDKPLYSDLVVTVDGQRIMAHKLVLAAHGRWAEDGVAADVTEITLPDLSFDVGATVLRWLYTDALDVDERGVDFLLDLLRAARRFCLPALVARAESLLMSEVTTPNCVEILIAATEVEALELKRFTMDFVMDQWEAVPEAAFASISAPLLNDMLKRKSDYPLHHAIRLGREDVVFLILIEHDLDIAAYIDRPDEAGVTPLHYALTGRHAGIAGTLVSHGCNVNARRGADGLSLLHWAIDQADTFAAEFLVNNGADVNALTPAEQTPLHLTAQKGLAATAEQVLKQGADLNRQNRQGNTAIHEAILFGNVAMVELFLQQPTIEVNCRNAEGHTPLWLALGLEDPTVARTLLARGCDLNLVTSSGDSMLHYAIGKRQEKACLFLIENNCDVSIANNSGVTPLHLAAGAGMSTVAAHLLGRGSDVNAADSESRTPLMCAITARHAMVTNLLLGAPHVAVNAKDAEGRCALGFALDSAQYDVAAQLLQQGASVESPLPSGLTLLHVAVMASDVAAALFLLENNADVHARTGDNRTPLQLAIIHGLVDVMDAICDRGADVNSPDAEGVTPLAMALETRQQPIATVLVRHGCDVNGHDAQGFTLLHRAILAEDGAGDEFSSTFLMRNGANVNDRDNEEGVSPLHLASELAQKATVAELLRAGADVNAQDNQGRTPMHRCIYKDKPEIALMFLPHPKLKVNVRDEKGYTVFGAAVAAKDQNVAAGVLRREPQAVEETDAKGMTYLHASIAASDPDTVKFLIKLGVNVNARVKDSTARTPLSMAVELGLEDVVRVLLASNADHGIPDRHSKWTVAHMAASLGFVGILDALMKFKADMSATDDQGSTVLHSAVRAGHAEVVRKLLGHPAVSAVAMNVDGETPLHTLARCPSESSAAILALLYPRLQGDVNPQDAKGNTPLFYAYSNGNASLCRGIVMNGGHLAMKNKQGRSCFDVRVPSLSLLHRLLGMLPGELPWIEGTNCQVCDTKFGVSTRKHHCRHCARILCKKDSSKQAPIAKFELAKPVRVCDICYSVLTGLVSTGGGGTQGEGRASTPAKGKGKGRGSASGPPDDGREPAKRPPSAEPAGRDSGGHGGSVRPVTDAFAADTNTRASFGGVPDSTVGFASHEGAGIGAKSGANSGGLGVGGLDAAFGSNSGPFGSQDHGAGFDSRSSFGDGGGGAFANGGRSAEGSRGPSPGGGNPFGGGSGAAQRAANPFGGGGGNPFGGAAGPGGYDSGGDNPFD